MKNKMHITTFIYALAFFWAALLLLQGYAVSWAFLKPISLVISFAILLLGAFEKWIWKWKWLYPWFVSTPDLIGTWKGRLVSDWINPETGQASQPIDAFLVVHQTHSSIKMRLITCESSSNLINGKLDQVDNDFRITGLYFNTPKATIRDRSAIHYGGLMLDVRQNENLILDGYYWTDRKTRGEMYFDNRVKQIFSTFDECENKHKLLPGG